MIRVKNRDEFLRQVASYLPRRCFAIELGVLNGDFSEMILSILVPDVLLLVDPFETGAKNYSNKMNFLPVAYSTEKNFKKVVKRFVNDDRVSVLKSYSHSAVSIIHEPLDFIYHDASHLYEDLKRDLKEWLPKLKKGGIMAGHDYVEHPDFGVIRAVDEFCKENGFEMIIYNENGGDYALKRK